MEWKRKEENGGSGSEIESRVYLEHKFQSSDCLYRTYDPNRK